MNNTMTADEIWNAILKCGELSCVLGGYHSEKNKDNVRLALHELAICFGNFCEENGIKPASSFTKIRGY